MTKQWVRSINGLGKLIDQYSTDEEAGKEDFGWLKDSVVELLKGDEAYENDNHFIEAVQDIESAENPQEFDEALHLLYDWADYERIWISPLP